jgi:hypothetical protein
MYVVRLACYRHLASLCAPLHPNFADFTLEKRWGMGKEPVSSTQTISPLDVQRYEWFRATLKEKFKMVLPSAEYVAECMGAMLGKIHWECGYDARDVEFVIGGAGYNGVLFYVLDFNQVCYIVRSQCKQLNGIAYMRPWNKSCDDVSVLVESGLVFPARPLLS